MRFTQKARIFFLLSGVIILSLKANAQLKGKIQETFTKSPIPFVHISINHGERHFLSDIDGYFEIPFDSSVLSLSFQTHLHRNVTIDTDSLKADSSLLINLNKHLYFIFDECTSEPAGSVMEQVMSRKKENSIAHLRYLSYSTYNKTTLTPEGVEKTNNSLEKLFKFFSLKFHTFRKDQHFLIVETSTHKNVYDKHHHKEVIEGAKSTIIDVPSLFIQTSQLYALSPYEDFINIGGKAYVSPLAHRPFTRYAFSMQDTIYTGSDTLFTIKYNPASGKHFDGLKGLLFINSKNFAIQYFTASPAKEKKLKVYAAQSYVYYPERNIWFPGRSKTLFLVEKSGEQFLATLDTYISDVNLNSFQNKEQFDEIILEYPDYAHQRDSLFWKKNRSIPLTPYDSNTYIYYDSADQKKFIQRTLQFGEHLFYGHLTYKLVDLELRKFADVNQYEGIRIGIGGHTNERFSNRFILGAYIGYGFKDTRTKFGTDITYRFRKQPISITTSYMDDVKEAGRVNFPLNQFQYPTETLRRLRINVMDRVIQWENSAVIHPVKYLDLVPAVSISKNVSLYDYRFNNERDNLYYFTELKLGIKYAFGEQFIKLLSRKISIGSKFPVVYFQYIKGLDGVLGGEYKYHKINLKIDYTLKVLDFGRTGVQLITGLVNGSVPYSKLYNGNGSFRQISVVIHNTFETMKYNEFLSDRYVSLFMSHNFGRLYFKNQHIRPSLLLLHNIGFGSLRNPSEHTQIPFKTMEKGYYESGMLLDNIFVFNITGLKIGLGAGFFLRYGPYANPERKDNLVFKFATNFSL